MSDEQFTGFTASFRPGGKDYDSPLLVVRANTVEELLVKLDADPDEDDLGTAVGRYHDKLRRQFDDAAGVAAVIPLPGMVTSVPASGGGAIWETGPASGPLTMTRTAPTRPARTALSRAGLGRARATVRSTCSAPWTRALRARALR